MPKSVVENILKGGGRGTDKQTDGDGDRAREMGVGGGERDQ